MRNEPKNMPPTTAMPTGMRLSEPESEGDREGAENSGDRGHQDRAETGGGSVFNRLPDGQSGRPSLVGKLHHENAVLRDEPDQHDESDLRKDVEGLPEEPE